MSNETQFTRGPWECDFKEHTVPYQKARVRSADYQYRVIAELWMDDAPLIDYNAEQKANARLIAQAPRMYAALETMATGEGLPPGETIERILADARGE